MTAIDRRTFLRRSGVAGGALAASGPLGAFTSRALADGHLRAPGYGPLVLKTDERGNALWLPREFEFVTVQQQGEPMRDGTPTPGIFDGMGAFQYKGRRDGDDHRDDDDRRRGHGRYTILIRNHENRERPGEIKVATGAREYDPSSLGGNTKVVVDPRAIVRRRPPYVVESFAILGGTSTNCAGGVTPWGSWITCEEVVKRQTRKHGYVFEIDAYADEPVPARAAPQFGRFSHEAISYLDGIFYLTEDRGLQTIDESGGAPGGVLGSLFYRFVPSGRRDGRRENIADLRGTLQALKVRGEPRANMDVGREVGRSYPVEWVTIPEPDHEDDTDNRLDRAPGFTPTRVQGYDRGAAVFDREEGSWVGDGKVYFDCTTGGEQNLGQVWEYDPKREALTLIYQSVNVETLENPDNVVIVPWTGDILLQEDSSGDQYLRGLTPDGRIYDFARSGNNDTEFCGGCFDPSAQILYVNQQGERGLVPDGPPDGRAVTYAIFGPFAKRRGEDEDDD